MTMHELTVMNAAAIESDELAVALFDKLEQEHDLNPKKWKILKKIIDEVSIVSDEDLSLMMKLGLLEDI